MRLCNQWLDFVQLRKEEADENSCVPKAVVLLPLFILFCGFEERNLSLRLFSFPIGFWNPRRGRF